MYGVPEFAVDTAEDIYKLVCDLYDGKISFNPDTQGVLKQLNQYFDNFDHWILFNGEGKRKLLCVEPQCGKSNGLNTDDGKIVISKGQNISFWTEISNG